MCVSTIVIPSTVHPVESESVFHSKRSPKPALTILQYTPVRTIITPSTPLYRTCVCTIVIQSTVHHTESESVFHSKRSPKPALTILQYTPARSTVKPLTPSHCTRILVQASTIHHVQTESAFCSKHSQKPTATVLLYTPVRTIITLSTVPQMQNHTVHFSKRPHATQSLLLYKYIRMIVTIHWSPDTAVLCLSLLKHPKHPTVQIRMILTPTTGHPDTAPVCVAL